MSVHADWPRRLEAAAEILGGDDILAQVLDATPEALATWKRGREAPPRLTRIALAEVLHSGRAPVARAIPKLQ